jgi:hypothetical protein
MHNKRTADLAHRSFAMPTAYRILRMSSLAFLAIHMVGCTSTPIDDGQARSRIKSVLSLSAETSLFIQQLQSHRLTRQFGEAHKVYLAKLQQGLASDKSTATTPQTATRLAVAKAQLNRLSEVINDLPLSPDGDSTYQTQKSSLADIDAQLGKALAHP